MKRRKHKIGSSWRTTRKIRGRRRPVIVRRVSRKKYKIRILKRQRR